MYHEIDRNQWKLQILLSSYDSKSVSDENYAYNKIKELHWNKTTFRLLVKSNEEIDKKVFEEPNLARLFIYHKEIQKVTDNKIVAQLDLYSYSNSK